MKKILTGSFDEAGNSSYDTVKIMKINTIREIISFHAEHTPNSVAIIGLNDHPITYKHLNDHIQELVLNLNDFGIGHNDCVAIVMPNGPMLAAAFLAISSAAVSAPINPAYTTSEFEFYLSDLKAKAVAVQKGSNSPVLSVARGLGIQILWLEEIDDSPEGLFSIRGEFLVEKGKTTGPSRMSDDALILHTSGTTSRPKIVPLTQKNLCNSASNIQATLNLTSSDRCLNIMPLFHIHGLVAAVLASLNAGASIVCTPGFLAPEFFKWLDLFKPTWYTAVPTMHQAILSRADNNLDSIVRNPLRFIRSSSSSLPPVIMRGLEHKFNAPVIEAYGMTEASHQMASNPLPPASRKAGSVGIPAGPEIAIMSEDENSLLPVGTPGEIVIRGQNVTLGYRNNPEANQKSFTTGWFRTGDQGYFDDEGYLFITGRLKELINRGGEKISPREIDEVLLTHPDILQAVTFAIPDEKLGEDIAAAVVLNGAQVTENELRKYVSDRLAPFKVPVRIIQLEEIPKGSTGKIQRIGLAQKLGFNNEIVKQPQIQNELIQPQTDTEKIISEVWKQVLDIPEAGINKRFRDLGGDSMLATLVHLKLETIFNMQIPLTDLFGAPTIADQAVVIEGQKSKKYG